MEKEEEKKQTTLNSESLKEMDELGEAIQHEAEGSDMKVRSVDELISGALARGEIPALRKEFFAFAKSRGLNDSDAKACYWAAWQAAKQPRQETQQLKELYMQYVKEKAEKLGTRAVAPERPERVDAASVQPTDEEKDRKVPRIARGTALMKGKPEPSVKQAEGFQRADRLVRPEAPREVEVNLPATYEEFQALDLRDEGQIVRAALGEAVDEYVYDFTIGGKRVTGISWAGAKAVARARGQFEVVRKEVTSDEDYWYADVYVRDKMRDLTLVGSVRQPKVMELKDGSLKENQFAYTTAISKGTRNALINLMPEGELVAFIKKYLAKVAQGKP